MSAAEPLSKSHSHVQSVLGSLAAGIAAMTVLSAMGVFIAQGGLETPAANAATPSQSAFAGAPDVRPLDVARIQAELNDVQASMRVTQAATDGAMARLQRLSGR
ncbi:MAG: hypothetical protein AB7L65_00925 [Hyphomonadaceae bacterium]